MKGASDIYTQFASLVQVTSVTSSKADAQLARGSGFRRQVTV